MRIDKETAARHAARKLFADHECEIDPDAEVVMFPDEPEYGAWVACWRLVPAAAIQEVIRTAESI